ncbi:MAG TPA: type I pantothenate kinase [Acidimicrobiia bacterium]|nr:type I pantothenate kinase [Acidimicrobiia bacterium]
MGTPEEAELDPYVDFTREEWSRLRASTPLTLNEDDVSAFRGLGEPMPMQEVEEVYLPLSRLLNLRVAATRELHSVTETFLGHLHARAPYVIGLAGSVAAGKSTIARMLQALLGRWPDHPRVDLVTTDGFLFPNAVLEARGLMARKGFPESYDVRALMRFLSELKAGADSVRAPKYSHLTYDILDDEEVVLNSPDIVIVEGVNVLQTPSRRGRAEASVVVSDFFDFSIYVDAKEEDLERWYIDRLLLLRRTSLHDPRSYFNFLTQYAEDDTRAFALSVWNQVNLVNLRENIAPTRGRANLVLEKDGDHAVRRVRLRKL